MSVTRKSIKRAVAVLTEEGLTPYDLVEWTHLLDVYVALKSETFLDLNVRHNTRGEVESALCRKAELLDSETKTGFSDFHSSTLNSFGIQNKTITYPPISPGTSVKTTKPNLSMRDEWTDEGWAERKWGVRGKVLVHHDSHGLCYDVRHEDGTVGCYDPSELEVVANA